MLASEFPNHEKCKRYDIPCWGSQRYIHNYTAKNSKQHMDTLLGVGVFNSDGESDRRIVCVGHTVGLTYLYDNRWNVEVCYELSWNIPLVRFRDDRFACCAMSTDSIEAWPGLSSARIVSRTFRYLNGMFVFFQALYSLTVNLNHATRFSMSPGMQTMPSTSWKDVFVRVTQ